MTYKLFIDDEREPVGSNWYIARTSQKAIDWVRLNGMPHEISFDHDLGGDDTVRRFVLWLTEEIIDGTVEIPQDFTYYVHSQNPIGAAWIRGTMDGLIQHFKKDQ